MEASIETSTLKAFGLSLGFQSVGICAATSPPHYEAYRSWLAKGHHGEMSYLVDHATLKQDPQNLLPEARSIVACALNYYQPISAQASRPRIARYALGRDYHKVLRGKLRKLAQWMETEHPGAQWRACVDSAPILERDFAQQAGLGFFGKNTMLIDPRRGSWFFIGLLLTTVPYIADVAAVGSCGSCTRCIDACPTGAIVFEEDRWQVDARKCISYLTIEKRGDIDDTLQPLMGGWTFGCDVCQEVCPFNEPRDRQPLRSSESGESDFSNRINDWPPLEELVNMRYEQWDDMTTGSAIRRAGYEGLKRNATINLKNLATSETD